MGRVQAQPAGEVTGGKRLGPAPLRAYSRLAMWQLVINGPGYFDTRYDVADGETQVGRADENEIVLSGDLVSRRHGKFHLSREVLQWEDLGSRNGSKVNGSVVIGTLDLKAGDVVQVGENKITVARPTVAESASTELVSTDGAGGVKRFGKGVDVHEALLAARDIGDSSFMKALDEMVPFETEGQKAAPRSERDTDEVEPPARQGGQEAVAGGHPVAGAHVQGGRAAGELALPAGLPRRGDGPGDGAGQRHHRRGAAAPRHRGDGALGGAPLGEAGQGRGAGLRRHRRRRADAGPGHRGGQRQGRRALQGAGERGALRRRPGAVHSHRHQAALGRRPLPEPLLAAGGALGGPARHLHRHHPAPPGGALQAPRQLEERRAGAAGVGQGLPARRGGAARPRAEGRAARRRPGGEAGHGAGGARDRAFRGGEEGGPREADRADERLPQDGEAARLQLRRRGDAAVGRRGGGLLPRLGAEERRRHQGGAGGGGAAHRVGDRPGPLEEPGPAGPQGRAPHRQGAHRPPRPGPGARLRGGGRGGGAHPRALRHRPGGPGARSPPRRWRWWARAST